MRMKCIELLGTKSDVSFQAFIIEEFRPRRLSVLTKTLCFRGFFILGGIVLPEGACRDIATISYWDRNARWHQLWAEHNDYHARIIHELMKRSQPHWRVLDIGAGNGVLSLPLAALGCDVTALEPSAAMRRLFFREAGLRRIGHVKVDDRAWTESSARDYGGCDLVVSCNSLHLCRGGATDAFCRIMAMQPRNIFTVTENGSDIIRNCACDGGYILQSVIEYEILSPQVYHSLEEAYEHWRFGFGTGTKTMDEHAFASRLRLYGGHWYFDETVKVSLLWWTNREISSRRRPPELCHSEKKKRGLEWIG
jgi:SAM-dependent methyltransferase